MERATNGGPQPSGKVVVIDDEQSVLRVVTRLLEMSTFDVAGFATAHEAVDFLESQGGAADTILTDLHLPQMSGLDLLKIARERWPSIPVILMTGRATVPIAVESMKLGAYDFLIKPFDPVGSLVASVRRALDYKQLVERNRYLERRVSLEGRFEEMVGTSPRMHRVFALIESVAPTDATVLILGESGTGKELVASAIHRRGHRRANPFVVINCGALAESVIDSELFGHVSGAFTGATSSRRGLFQEASGGTLFLDEVGELPPATQVRLLRVLQEGEIRPVGSNDAKKVNVRVIAATHRDLQKEVKEGRFREDLFYRLNVVTIGLPSLRERREDLAALVWHFVEKHATKLNKKVTGIEPRALELLTRHAWPGNVRELENALERAVILTQGPILDTEALPPSIVEETQSIVPVRFAPRPLLDVEREHILKTLEHTGWRIEGASGAAASLDLKPATLRSRMQKLGIRRPGS